MKEFIDYLVEKLQPIKYSDDNGEILNPSNAQAAALQLRTDFKNLANTLLKFTETSNLFADDDSLWNAEQPEDIVLAQLRDIGRKLKNNDPTVASVKKYVTTYIKNI